MKHDTCHTPGDPFDTRVDRVELKGGIAALPDEFRQVALLANMAGIQGYEVVDVEYGLDPTSAKIALENPDFDALGSGLMVRVEIHYRRPHREKEQAMPKLIYEVMPDDNQPGDWRVEAGNEDGDGEVYVAIFSGPEAERRAREYADWKSAT